jgi:uncharacterized protein (DUF983 family)
LNCLKALNLVEKYSICPQCGNGKIGNGEGKMFVGDTTFSRECKCGWKIKTDENGNEVK